MRRGAAASAQHPRLKPVLLRPPAPPSSVLPPGEQQHNHHATIDELEAARRSLHIDSFASNKRAIVAGNSGYPAPMATTQELAGGARQAGLGTAGLAPPVAALAPAPSTLAKSLRSCSALPQRFEDAYKIVAMPLSCGHRHRRTAALPATQKRQQQGVAAFHRAPSAPYVPAIASSVVRVQSRNSISIS